MENNGKSESPRPAAQEDNKKLRLLMLPGDILWIAGLVLTIVGLNVKGDTGNWMTIAGNISFLLGLGLLGALWFIRHRRDEEQSK